MVIDEVTTSLQAVPANICPPLVDRGTRLLGSAFDKHHLRRRTDNFAMLNHRSNLLLNRLVDVGGDFFNGVARRDAAREVGRSGGRERTRRDSVRRPQ